MVTQSDFLTIISTVSEEIKQAIVDPKTALYRLIFIENEFTIASVGHISLVCLFTVKIFVLLFAKGSVEDKA